MICQYCKENQGIERYIGGDYDSPPRREISCGECRIKINTRNWTIILTVVFSIVLILGAMKWTM